MTKKEMRALFREKAAALSGEYKKEASMKIQEIFLNSEEFLSAESVFVYISSDNEPSTVEIIKEALALGKRVYVPKCIKKGIMEAVRLTRETVLVEGYMGLKEPEFSKETARDNIDVSVIPCMSCSADGKRLGHGGGFYDRFLFFHETKKICLCFGKMLSLDIETEAHDVQMDIVITEDGFFCN